MEEKLKVKVEAKERETGAAGGSGRKGEREGGKENVRAGEHASLNL